ncbi:MAG: DMT family transporter [Pseudomonadales bacterium]|nr:DMT family transporter [Pseudomonadales bacterium]MBO6597779.1 DMT family transporter [Pseudomonadales bacterium]MBO6824017.1 DMT family transporter [Pseudomonadales bacterium]
MLESWIFWSLLAATMQSVRTAGQKYLTADVSPLGATLVRYLFGLPFITMYLGWLMIDRGHALPTLNATFLVYGIAAGFLQIIATVLLIRLFALRNFAVGSCYIRTEVLITAILGLVLFAELISMLGWLAIVTCVVGLVLITIAKSGKISDLWNLSAIYGIGAGLAFSLTSLLIRQASLSFGTDDAMFTAALTLAYMIVVQTIMCLAMLAYVNALEILTVFKRWRPSVFVGFTSVIGSAGWFTAFTLERAAYVKTLGQIEFLLTLAISIIYFKEKPSRMEWVGMVILVLGVVLLLLSP